MDKKDKENKNIEIDAENNKRPEKKEGDNYLTEGMCLGICLGVSVGQLLFKNIGLGMCVGMCLGLAIGSGIKKKK